MTEKKKKKKEELDKPQEEFIGEGLAKNKKVDASDSNQKKYEDWKIEELHREARLKSVENYIEMDKNELIRKLKSHRFPKR
ncbi:hypothetical protein BH23BAC3_BH23BAC3_17490 [soil metagenome]